MKIGIDARLWDSTGVGRYIRMLFKYLPKEENIVWFFSQEQFDSVTMPSVNWKKVLAKPHWHTITEQFVMTILFYKENLDLLHVPYVNFPFFYFKKVVSTIHDLIPDHYKTGRASTLPFWFYPIKKLGYHFLVWIATSRALKIFTLSQDAKNEIIDHYQVDPKKIIVTYEAGTLEDSRVKSDRPKKFQPYLLYVGNAHPHKNVQTLIKAAEILKMRLVLLGNDGFFYSRLPKSKYVEVLGFIPNDEIAAWYKYALALVTASKMEGFGIPPLEAMTMGCPVILSDIPVFHEINGDAAVYFNPTDPKDVAKVIKATLADKKLLKTLVSRGYTQASKYSWKKCVEQTNKIYEDSLSLRSGK